MDVLIDYLTLSDKEENIFNIMEAFGLTDAPFLTINGRYGWRKALFYRGVTIYHGGREDIGFNLSGKGCRTVEAARPGFDWLGFLLLYLDKQRQGAGHISRLDIAADDHEGLLDMQKLFRYIATDRYICKAKFRTWTQGSEEHCYFGSPSSATRLRVYNKALEQGVDGHWIRAEMQLRDEAAVSFLLNLEQTGLSVGETYAGVLLNYLRFIREPVQGENYSRAAVVGWWVKFLGAMRKLPNLSMPAEEYSLASVYSFIEHQAGSSLRTWLEANHGDMTDLLAMVEGAKLNKRQKELLQKIQSCGIL